MFVDYSTYNFCSADMREGMLVGFGALLWLVKGMKSITGVVHYVPGAGINLFLIKMTYY